MLIRPLGDVVVLMPMLTSTAEEIERIVDALADSVGAVAAQDAAGDVDPAGPRGSG